MTQEDNLAETDEWDLFKKQRRELLKLGALAIPVSSSVATFSENAAADSSSELWSISLDKTKGTRLEMADTDGDGTDEVGISSLADNGPSNYGIVDEGNWVWKNSSSAAVQAASSGDVDGDGHPEIIFRAKISPVWVRPYTHSGDYLWNGDMPDWPDSAVTVDYDDDGKSEIASLSGYYGYFRVFDDDGSVEWDLQSNNLVDNLLDFRNVNDGQFPELLTPTGRSSENTGTGLQLVKKTGNSTGERVWEYGPTELVRAKFADVDNDGELEALAAYPNIGEVHAVDTDGTELWIESVNISGGDGAVFDVDGDGISDAILWSGTDIAVVNGSTQETTTFSTDSTVQSVEPFAERELIVVTQDSVARATLQSGVEDSRNTSREVQDVAAGDINGDGTKEVVIGFTDEVIAVSDLSTGTDTEKPKATVNIDDARVVQTVSNTRISNVEGSDVEDPPIVAGVPASVAFGINTDSLSNLPDGAEVDATVTTTGTSATLLSFTLTKEQLSELETGSGGYPVTEFASLFDGQNPPVFDATTGIESVKIELESSESDSYEIESQPIELIAGDEFEVREMPPLKIGLIDVQAPVIGTNSDGSDKYPYGSPDDGTIDGSLDDFADRLTTFLEDEYPVSEVEVSTTSQSVVGVTYTGLFSIRTDLANAYQAVYDEYPEVDVALAVVPFINTPYFDYHNKPGTRGVESWGVYNELQTQEAAAVQWFPESVYSPSMEATEEVAAQEITHHFLPAGIYEGNYTWDGNHVVPDSNPSENNPDGVKSTKLDVDVGTYSSKDGLYSFMSYVNIGRYGNSNIKQYDVVSDARTHEELINGEFQPQPPETVSELFGDVLRGYVDISADLTVEDLTFFEGSPLPSAENGDVTVRVKNGRGDLIDERTTSRITTTHVSGGGKELTIAQFVVPFPNTVAEVEIETTDSYATFDPISGTLSELISALLADSFNKNPEQRRNTLQNKLDEVENMMKKKNYRPAANKLENDILDKLQKWLVSTSPEGANIPSKQDVIEQTQEMIDRVNTLEQEFGSKNSGNRGNTNRER